MEVQTTRLGKLSENIDVARQNVINHSLYEKIKSIDDLRVFMRHHVYAVWDFMTLLKSLQNELTCTNIPWYPKGDPNTRYLINEIVVDEESDIDQNGIRKSHFEMYLDAMFEINADQGEIETFLSSLQKNETLKTAFRQAGTPSSVQHLVKYTLDIAMYGKPHVKAAVFTFGREDLIPNMFLSIIGKLFDDPSNQVGAFKYYLERHIEVDGGHHSDLAKQMTAILCGDDNNKWKEAEEAVIKALELRAQLWEGVLSEIK